MKLATAEQMRELDRRAIQEVGIPGILLMENAGRGAAELIRERYGPRPRKVAVLCGRGNNGGDGLVIARHLRNWGWDVRVYLFAPKGEVTGDAKVNLDIWIRMGGEVVEVLGDGAIPSLREDLALREVLVDALLGTGLKDEVKGLMRQAIELVNSLGKPVVAVDIPSGLHATTGKVLGAAVRADLTVTFGLPKVGQVVHPGADLVGDLRVVDISIPKGLIEEADLDHVLLDPEELTLAPLGPRPKDVHKGNYGHLLLVAGSTGKTGACAMAAEAALRVGTGLVTAAVPGSLNPILEVKLTEVMTEPLPDEGGFFSPEALPKALELLGGKSAIAIGPGMGQGAGARALVREIVRAARVPMVIDADGINCLVGALEVLKEKGAPVILTPHPGEMARLLGTTPKEVQGDRIGVARSFAREHDVILVLKGARTVVAEPSGKVFINPTGNPGMASGGMGDILTGMIGGFLAQGMDPIEAAKLGVYLHGLSGDMAREDLGEPYLSATDLLRYLPKAMRGLGSWSSS